MLPAGIERHRFDVAEYHRMLEAGVLSEDHRVELIGGEIVDMTPIGRSHLSCVVALTHLLVMAAGGRCYVSVQNAIRLGPSDEPQPDISLIRTHPELDAEGPPGSDEVLSVIEVGDTSLAYDRDVELPLYARAGISEVWIVDLRGRKVGVYAGPASGGYGVYRTAGPGEQLSSETVEGLSLSVDEVLR